MEIFEYIIFGGCIIGVGYTSYSIGYKEGIRLGAGLMWDRIWMMGKPKRKDPMVRIVELHKDSI